MTLFCSLPWTHEALKLMSEQKIWPVSAGRTCTKIGTIQRRLAWHGPCARMTRKIVKRSKFKKNVWTKYRKEDSLVIWWQVQLLWKLHFMDIVKKIVKIHNKNKVIMLAIFPVWNLNSLKEVNGKTTRIMQTLHER